MGFCLEKKFLQVELNNYSIRPSEQDRWMWVAGSENIYTVRGAYAWLYEAVVG